MLNTIRFHSLIASLFVLFLASCSSATPEVLPSRTLVPTVTNTFTVEPSPTATSTYTPIPTKTATASPTPTATLTATPVMYDGVWSGKTSAGNNISFTVKDNQIVLLSYPDVQHIGNCKLTFSPIDFSNRKIDTKVEKTYSILISENSFLIDMGDLAGTWGYKFSGTFDSGTTASGIYLRRGKTCDSNFVSDLTWTATRQPQKPTTPVP